MVRTRSSLDTSKGFPCVMSERSRKRKTSANPLSSEQLGQKRKSAPDTSPSEQPVRKKQARETRFAAARCHGVAPIHKKRKSGEDDFASEGHKDEAADDSEPSNHKKLKVTASAAEEGSGRKLLSRGPTLLSMPREVRDMILGCIVGNRTLHIERGNTWKKVESAYQVLDRDVLRHAVCEAHGTTRLSRCRKGDNQSTHDEESRTYFQRHGKCCRPSSDISCGYEFPSFVSNEVEHITPAILQTCRQLHDEGTTIMYGSNTFSFTDASSFQKFLRVRTRAQASEMKSIELGATGEMPDSANPGFMTPKCRSYYQEFYQSLSSWNLEALSLLQKLTDLRLYYLDQTPMFIVSGQRNGGLRSAKTRIIKRGLKAAFGDLRFLDCVKSSCQVTVKVAEYFGPINCNTNPATLRVPSSSSLSNPALKAHGALADSEVDRLAKDFKTEIVSPMAHLQVLFDQEEAINTEERQFLATKARCLKSERQIQAQRSRSEEMGRKETSHRAKIAFLETKMRRYRHAYMKGENTYLHMKKEYKALKRDAEDAGQAKQLAASVTGRMQIELNDLERQLEQRVKEVFWPLEDRLQSLRDALGAPPSSQRS